jgi:chromosome segregation ATPase
MKYEPSDRELEATRAEPDDLEQQIRELRAELGELVHELDRRRHAAFDVREQLRRHPGAVAVVAGSIALIVARRVWVVRSRNVRGTLARAMDVARVVAVLAKEASAWRLALL